MTRSRPLEELDHDSVAILAGCVQGCEPVTRLEVYVRSHLQQSADHGNVAGSRGTHQSGGALIRPLILDRRPRRAET